MPYISQQIRGAVRAHGATTPGELNFLLTETVMKYINRREPNYMMINDVLGALEGAKLEFYRQVVVPYEDRKREENGCVYT